MPAKPIVEHFNVLGNFLNGLLTGCETGMKDQPGFRDYVAGSQIHEYLLNKDHWTEGFISVAKHGVHLTRSKILTGLTRAKTQ